MRWIIIGCGYSGTRLAARLLREGHEVVATRRSEQGVAAVRAALGDTVDLRVVDLADPATLGALDMAGATVVVSAPPSQPVGEAERALASAAEQARRIVYLSSTGVYPHMAGAVVDEDTPVAPLGPRGAMRLAAETALLDRAAEQGTEAVSLRLSAIYGPGRGVHQRLHDGNYRIIGDGSTAVCRIHVDDVVQVIVAAATVDPLPRRIYTVADDLPAPSRQVADEIAALLGVAPAASVDPAEVSESVRAMLGADRRVSNARIVSELGVTLLYPSFREGVRQALTETGDRP